MLPSAYVNKGPSSIYEGMVTGDRSFAISPPSFTPKHSDVNTSAGSPGYEGAPNHYKGASGIQVFDVWDAYEMDRYRATAFKYFARYNLKGSMVNDLDKLSHYIYESVVRTNFAMQPIIDFRVIRLTPAVVIPSFGLEGLMADACLDFLLSFTTRNPKTYLRAAKSQVDEYIASLGAVHS
jgi:hypothetical protein